MKIDTVFVKLNKKKLLYNKLEMQLCFQQQLKTGGKLCFYVHVTISLEIVMMQIVSQGPLHKLCFAEIFLRTPNLQQNTNRKLALFHVSPRLVWG
jgi:hypothetical protein